MYKLLFLILIFSTSLFATPINKQIIMDISRTYGYYQGQLYSLNTIKKKYPKLANDVFVAKSEFDSSFGKSIENIDTLMDKYDGWKSIKKDIVKNIHTKLNLSKLTYQESIQFIQLVKQRAKGNIETPVLETLLMLNPEYEENPEKEFYDGFKKRYKCDDFKKSKGVDFLIDIPMSWASKKANRPNIVRKFIAQNGYNPVMVMIQILNFSDGKYLSTNDIKRMVNKKQMQKALPANTKLKDYGFIKLETLPGYWQRYSMKVQRIRKTITFEVLAYTIIYGNKLIKIQFMVGDFKNKNLNTKFKKFEPLFDSIINSFVLTSLYKQ